MTPPGSIDMESTVIGAAKSLPPGESAFEIRWFRSLRGVTFLLRQESNQRSRLKGQARAPARDAFPLRIPQPRIWAESGMFRVGAGRGDCHASVRTGSQ